MLKIRLTRIGRKKRPFYRIVLTEASRSNRGRYIELLGSLDPHKRKESFIVKEDRIRHWLSHGAEASVSVHNLLADRGIIKEKKKKATRQNKKKAQKQEQKAQDAKSKKAE